MKLVNIFYIKVSRLRSWFRNASTHYIYLGGLVMIMVVGGCSFGGGNGGGRHGSGCSGCSGEVMVGKVKQSC